MNRYLIAALACITPSVAGAQSAGPLPLQVFGYERRPLAVSDSLLRTDADVSIHAISFPSPWGGRATGLLFVPAGPGPFAGVVVQHGAPGRVDSTLLDILHQSVMPNAMAIAAAGAVVVALDAPWARRLAPPVTFTVQDSVDQVQLIVDLQRAVDLLLARPDVDPKRLGYVGRSYGGAMGALLAGVERRIATYVLQVGDGGLLSHFTGDAPPGIPAERWHRWVAAMRPIEPIGFIGRAAPASIYFQSAIQDRSVTVPNATALHQAAGEPKQVQWYDTGHGLNDQSRLDMLAWLHQRIGTRKP